MTVESDCVETRRRGVSARDFCYCALTGYINHCEQNALKKVHNARIDDEVYNQRSMSETVFAMLKDEDDDIRSRSWHGQFRELTRKCIVHNLSQAASCNELDEI